jgi:seryl-tRNA synthetase
MKKDLMGMVAELADYDETLYKIEGKGANPEEANGEKVTNDDLTM